MTLIIQQSYMVHLGQVIDFREDHTEDEWRYLVTIKFDKPSYQKKALEVMIGTGTIWVKQRERLLGFYPMKPPQVRMFAIFGEEYRELGECRIAEIPLFWEEIKERQELQLMFYKEGRREFIESLKSVSLKEAFSVYTYPGGKSFEPNV